LVAPPYDVIDPALQSRLYARSPYNVVRVDLGITTPSDNDCDNRYTRAAALLDRWKAGGVLVRDPEPAVTFVEESFTGPDGRPSVRHGLLAAVRLHDFGEGVIFPHEETFSGPKEDRYRLMAATGMSLSPVFLLYDLPADEITSAWRTAAGGDEPYLAVCDEEGTTTRLWRETAPERLRLMGEVLAEAPLIIADGHHRYETALRYRDHRRSQAPGGETEGRAAHEYVLAYLSNMADPALTIYATHRLVKGLDPARIAALPETLASDFVVERLGGGLARGAAAPSAAGSTQVAAAAQAQAAITAYLKTNRRGAFGLWVPDLTTPYGLRSRRPAVLEADVPGHSPAYRGLDVVIMESLIFQKALEIESGPGTEEHVTYFKDAGDAFARLAAGEFQAGLFMNPTGLDQVREVALGGERMPQKATFFYPKLPTGLVFYDLIGAL
jgi:uncharacterized protein (DUF1015 family)